MYQEFKTRLADLFKPIQSFLGRGKMRHISVIVYLIAGAFWVYLSPRSLVAFLFFLSSAGVIYSVKVDNRTKLDRKSVV